jgi:hypothetical protein
MAHTKAWALQKAVEVTIAYGNGGSTRGPDTMLEGTYNKLLELLKDVKNEKEQGRVDTAPSETSKANV